MFLIIKITKPCRILFHNWLQSLDFDISNHLKMLKLIFYMYWPFILIGRQVMPSSSRWNFTKRSLSPDLICVIRVISWFRLRRSVRKVTWCELFPYSFWRYASSSKCSLKNFIKKNDVFYRKCGILAITYGEFPFVQVCMHQTAFLHNQHHRHNMFSGTRPQTYLFQKRIHLNDKVRL